MKQKILILVMIFIAFSVYSQVYQSELYEVGIFKDGTAYIAFTGGFQCMIAVDLERNVDIVASEFLTDKVTLMRARFITEDKEIIAEYVVDPSSSGFSVMLKYDDVGEFIAHIKRFTSVIITIYREDSDLFLVPFDLTQYRYILKTRRY